MRYFILMLLGLCSVCSVRASVSTVHETVRDSITTFVYPTIPDTLRSPELRADYLVRHYWDCTQWADSNYAHHPEIMEQAWVNYIDLLKLVPAEVAHGSISGLMKQAEASKPCFDYLGQLAETYLYEPGSPMRNEEYYIRVLDVQLASPLLSEVDKIRPRYRRRMAEKNRKMKVAENFTYTLAKGEKGNMHDISSPYTLLFLNNPGCHTCKETTEALQQSVLIKQLVKSKQLIILSVYPDEEVDEWRYWLDKFPTEWINAYDAELSIRNRELYDLRVMPGLYLLDADKRVLIKDGTVTQIEEWLKDLGK